MTAATGFLYQGLPLSSTKKKNKQTKKKTKKNNESVIRWPRSVRTGRNCARGLEYSRSRAEFLPVRASRPVNNIHLFSYHFVSGRYSVNPAIRLIGP